MLGRAFDLLEDVALQIGSDVGQENVFGVAEFFGELGLEVGEDVEVGDQGFAFIEMLGIFSGPEEGFAGSAFQAGGVNLAAVEDGLRRFRRSRRRRCRPD